MIVGMAVAQAALGAGQSIYGMIDARRQRKERDRLLDNQPTYEIPQELMQNMTESEMLAYQGLPEAQKQEFLDNIRRSSQFTLASASSRSGSMMALPMVAQQMNDAYRNVLSQDAAARMQNIQLAQQARGVVAAQREKQFEINEMMPFVNRVNANTDDLSYARSILGAGIQNMFDSGKSMALAGNDENADPFGIKARRARKMANAKSASTSSFPYVIPNQNLQEFIGRETYTGE